jgi:hypothetical protein
MSSTPDPIDPDAEFLLDPVVDPVEPATEAAEPAAEPAAPADEASEPAAEPSAPASPDPRLLEAHDLALAALREITPASTIGEPADYRMEADGVVSLRFTNRLAGYPGWFWTVSLARVEDAEPTVLEVELLPGEGALIAPDWVPWAVRLADYHAAQAAAQAESAADDDDETAEGEELDDVDDLDAADFDDDGSPILHAGDVDGVDIDELADLHDDDSDEDDDDSDDEDDDSDDDEDDDDEDDSDDDDDFDDDDEDGTDEEDDDEDFDSEGA